VVSRVEASAVGIEGVSGFTFIKNGLTLGYPIKESIASLAPLCEEVIINVGFDDPELTRDDGTYHYLKESFPEVKYKFLKNYWDPQLTARGEVLAQQTNLALEACRGQLAFYIQGDEVLHEEDYPAIRAGIQAMRHNEKCQGLIFTYVHFYGNAQIVKETRNVYRREVRIIRRLSDITSWRDAQGFRFKDGEKLQCDLIPARIFHYGWAREQMVMAKKVEVMDRLYHGAEFQQKEQFQYQNIWGLKAFKGTHPAIMQNWIRNHHNELDLAQIKRKFEWKNLGLCLSDWIESKTGWRMGEYKGYRRI
jgi:hypothetical protein